MARRRRYTRKRRQGQFSFLYKILIFVAICGAIDMTQEGKASFIPG